MTDAERIEAEEERRRKKREADMVRYLLIKPIFLCNLSQFHLINHLRHLFGTKYIDARGVGRRKTKEANEGGS
jgi:hypothetical protein